MKESPPARTGKEQVAIKRAVVPAAGLGTRLRPLTTAIPKEMLPVGRLPVLAHVMRELAEAGITEVLLIISNAKPQIRSYFGEQYACETASGICQMNCSYTIQEEQKGLGHAIGLAREWTQNEPFVVAFGDCMVEAVGPVSPLQRLVQVHSTASSSATCIVETVAAERVSRYGIVAHTHPPTVKVEHGIELADIVEKPALDRAPSRMAVAARWALTAPVFDFLARGVQDSRGEVNLTDSVRMMKQSGGALWAVPLAEGEARRDIGGFSTYFEAFIRAAMRDPEFGPAACATAAAELHGE